MTTEFISPKVVVVCGIVLFLAIALLSLDGWIKVQHDSGIYISLGKAMVGNQGYTNVFRPTDPPHTHYPPVFPFLLTIPIAMFGDNFLAMKLMVMLFAVAALWVLYHFLAQIVAPGVAALGTVLTATSHGILFYSQSIMSEIPYLLFSLLALLWLEKRLPDREWSWKTAIVATLLISLAYLTRLVGISLLGAMVAVLVFEGHGRFGRNLQRGVAMGSIVAAPALIWCLRNWMLTESVSPVYWDGYTLSASNEFLITAEGGPAIIDRIIHNLYKYAVHFGKVILLGVPPLVATGLAVCVFIGFLWRSVRDRTILEYYVVCYMCIVILFPGTRPQRYVVPLIPFIWFYFIMFVYGCGRWIRNQVPGRELGHLNPRWAANLVLVVLLVANAGTAVWGNVVRKGREGYYHVRGESGYVDVVPWVRKHTKGDSTFLWAKPSLRFLLAGRKAFRFDTKEGARGLIREGKVDYVVVDAFSETSKVVFEPIVSDEPEKFELVYENEVSKVYEVQKEPGSVGRVRQKEQRAEMRVREFE